MYAGPVSSKSNENFACEVRWKSKQASRFKNIGGSRDTHGTHGHTDHTDELLTLCVDSTDPFASKREASSMVGTLCVDSTQTLSQASNQALLGWRKSQVKSFVNIKNIHTAQSLDRPSWGHWPIVPSFQRRRAHIPSEEELRALIKFHKQFPIYVW